MLDTGVQSIDQHHGGAYQPDGLPFDRVGERVWRQPGGGFHGIAEPRDRERLDEPGLAAIKEKEVVLAQIGDGAPVIARDDVYQHQPRSAAERGRRRNLRESGLGQEKAGSSQREAELPTSIHTVTPIAAAAAVPGTAGLRAGCRSAGRL